MDPPPSAPAGRSGPLGTPPRTGTSPPVAGRPLSDRAGKKPDRAGTEGGMTTLAPAPRPEAAGSVVADPLPCVDPIERLPILILYPHSRCNCRCLMCDIWRARGKGEISRQEIEGWLPEWRALGVRRIVLSGGEALLHSDLDAFCEPLREAGIGITLLSTGLLLRRDASRLVRWCDDVIVSLDGPQV